MTSRSINFKDIETPTTVEEFRENLRKYCFIIKGKTKDLDCLYVQDEWNIKIEDLDSMDSLYSMTTNGSPSVIPMVEWNMNDVKDYMEENDLYHSWGFFEKTEKYKIIESGLPLMEWNSSWVKVCDPILCEFFIKTLGNYSGYKLNN